MRRKRRKRSRPEVPADRTGRQEAGRGRAPSGPRPGRRSRALARRAPSAAGARAPEVRGEVEEPPPLARANEAPLGPGRARRKSLWVPARFRLATADPNRPAGPVPGARHGDTARGDRALRATRTSDRPRRSKIGRPSHVPTGVPVPGTDRPSEPRPDARHEDTSSGGRPSGLRLRRCRLCGAGASECADVDADHHEEAAGH
jgi:hypothetical protein